MFQLPITRSSITIPVDLCSFPIKGLNDPNYPNQLFTRSFKIDYSHPIPPKFCTIKAYGSTANPTSNHLASSSYVSQWLPVARWETNGDELLPSVQYGKNDQDYGRNAYDLCRKLVCVDEDAVINTQLPFYRPEHFQPAPNESVRPVTVSSSSTGMENGQIAPLKVSSPLTQMPNSSRNSMSNRCCAV